MEPADYRDRLITGQSIEAGRKVKFTVNLLAGKGGTRIQNLGAFREKRGIECYYAHREAEGRTKNRKRSLILARWVKGGK